MAAARLLIGARCAGGWAFITGIALAFALGAFLVGQGGISRPRPGGELSASVAVRTAADLGLGSAGAPGPVSAGAPKAFAARNFSLSIPLPYGGSVDGLAESAIHRKRTSGIFIYENYSDVWLEGLRITVRVPQDARPSDRSDVLPYVARALAESMRGVTQLAAPDTGVSPDPSTESGAATQADAVVPALDSDSDVVMRALLHKPSLAVFVGNQPVIEIEAEAGTFYLESRCAALQGNVSITTQARVLRAQRAVWHIRRGTIYVPESHEVNGQASGAPALFAVEWNGGLRPVAAVPVDAECSDPFDEMERRLFRKLAEKAQEFMMKSAMWSAETAP